MSKFTVLNKHTHTLQSQRNLILDKAEKHLASLLPDQVLKQTLTAVAMLALPSLPQLYETFINQRLFALRSAKSHRQSLQILLMTQSQSMSTFNPFVPVQTIHFKQVPIDTSSWWSDAIQSIKSSNTPPSGTSRQLVQERDDIIRYLERESAPNVWKDLSKEVYEKAFIHNISIAWSSLSGVLLATIRNSQGNRYAAAPLAL